MIDNKLLSQYQDLWPAFSKTALDTLALHQKYNLKIDLEGHSKNELGFSLLYQYTAKELCTCKQYLVENLYKGFIAKS